MEEASLSSYRPVIVHAWFLATDRALGALVRLRGYAGQSKARIGMSSFFSLIVCFTSIGKTGSFHHVLCLELGPLVGKGKRSKLAAILLLPGYYSSYYLLSHVVVLLSCTCLVVKGRLFLTSPPDIQACFCSHRLADIHLYAQCPQSRRPRRPQLDTDYKSHRRHHQLSIIHHH
jgi:hypothetical protein